MSTRPQSPTTMGERRGRMFLMARDNDMAGIARLLDEGVNPAANEERPVRLMVGRCIG